MKSGNLFYAAFIPGLQGFVANVIKERLSDVRIHKLLDGAVLFETETTYDKLNFFCFNNIFACINIFEDHLAETQRRGDRRVEEGRRGVSLIEKHINNILSCKEESKAKNSNNFVSSVLSVFNFDPVKKNSKNFNTFRIVVSDENVPASIDEKLRTQAEKFISSVSGLKVNRSLPDTEFWFLYRRDDNSKRNFSIFMKRLTLRSSWEKTLHKGELLPPLAWTLCRLAELKHSDTVLDPFCGYGSIPETAFKHFHITNFIACDNDSEAAQYSTARFIKRKKGEFNFYRTDFSELPSLLRENTIDTIVTDPPWGHFKESGTDGFLEKMFLIFNKLLKEGGRVVILYANDDSFAKTIPASFELKTQIPILLSGKKAVIYIINKNN